jgi:geranylgeranyl pyrophosphate synthase
MNLAVKLLESETDLATQMTALYEGLPGKISASEELDPGFLERALLDPARDIMRRTGKGLRAQLLEHCWQLSGGDPDGPPELLPVFIELLHSGSLVIDDIEDDSPMRRGETALHRRYGVPIALNTGNWLYFLPLGLLARSDLSPRLRLALFEDLSAGLLRCHQGQALDLSVKISDLPKSQISVLVERVTRLKTGSLMELAALIGARAATTDRNTIAALAHFGTEFGVALQMLDDWSGIANRSRRHKGIEDLRLQRPTWIWVWLAEFCDEVTFAEMSREVKGITIDWEAEQLLSRMEARLRSAPRPRITEHLQAALDELAGSLGESAELQSLRDAVGRLERAYV